MDAGRLAEHKKIVAVHAHPDDETITMGGTLAKLVAQGASVTVVTATRGECGEVIPADLAHLYGSEELAAHRTAELVVALTALGVGDHRFLGESGARAPGLAPRVYRDSGMQWGPDRVPVPLEPLHPAAFTAAPEEEQIADLLAVLDQVDADLVLSYDVGGGYGHPDHIRVARIASLAAERHGIPLFVVLPEAASVLSVDVNSELDDEEYSRKRTALAAHATQVVVEGEQMRLSSGEPFPIGRVERFRRVGSENTFPAAGALQERPGLGSRLLYSPLSLALGAVVGVITTIAHQRTLVVGDLTLPVGLVASLAAVALLLLGLRLVMPDRFVVLCTAMGLLVMIGLFSLRSTGGSVLIPANGWGIAWIILSAVIALVVIAWPRLRMSTARVHVDRRGPRLCADPYDRGHCSKGSEPS
ncbi:PIG-L family deacetylase [Rathayibacter toxicus]|uniref:Mycothiol biosynthesis protein n=1 Tax=Rathayibacter toxicus TaxID=145458 RepID=A0A2S5Y657_9MICO|nr:PIG-L family deacetylase [Rathayibacter toxicus]PPH22648.1 mycothiol biosynthesis protein [Rathayibacter toxicus]PPH56850.1 mycothiol biosynthesis protein [Rathayibacter toxicus]PPH59542.1 mycothiol biosynthesis protein [Rathayibacter toxicus]PPH86772.1 mycothiol biosynthesis protein [Rathayibacter toxicus]PPI14490.1 mycothiol biosynthesis protein [Rathayibacter toxicus]